MRRKANTMKSKSFHFFKVILPATLQVMKLRIPQEFVRESGDQLFNVAMLTLPNGRVWKVGLKREGEKIWLNDGWNEFVEHHSIYAGCFLVFKYQQNSKFHVLIFDKTGCEIQYPYNDEEPAENVRQNLEDVNESRKLNKNDMYNSRGSLYPKEHPNGNAENLRASSSFALQPVNNRIKYGYDKHELVALIENMGICITRRYSSLAAKDIERALDVARSVHPVNPAFIVILRADKYNSFRSRLYVPATFAKKHFGLDVKFINLQNSHGKEWPIQITWERIAGYNLFEGWAEFASDNNLNGGDICLFELTRRNDFYFKVSVSHALL